MSKIKWHARTCLYYLQPIHEFVCLLNRKMFIGGLNWQTTPGTYYELLS